MSARSTMTMRATVSRDDATAKDSHGQPVPPNFVDVGIVPCRAWSKQRRDVDDSGKSGVIEDLRAVVPGSADIEEEDQLVIRDRRGVTLFGGPVLVEARMQQSGSGSAANHYELMLKRHTAS